MSDAAHRSLRAQVKQAGRLIRAHKNPRPLAWYKQFAGDRARFAKEVFGITLWDKQVETLDLLDDNRVVVVMTGWGIGKTLMAAIEIYYQLLVLGPALVLCASAVGDQLQQQTFGQLEELWASAKRLPGRLDLPDPTGQPVDTDALDPFEDEEPGMELPGKLSARTGRYEIDRGQRWGVYGIASNKRGRVTGYHHPNRTVVVIDEAHGVLDELWDSGFLAIPVAEADRLIAFGNPGELPTGAWYEVTQRAAYTQVRIPSTLHPNIREQRTVVRGAISQQKVDEFARVHGVDSPMYRRLVEGCWPDGFGSAALLTPEMLDRTNALWKQWLQGREPDDILVIGVDVAKTARTAVGIGYRRYAKGWRSMLVVQRFVTWTGATLPQTEDRLAELLVNLGVKHHQEGHSFGTQWAHIVIDDSGLAGVADHMKRRGFSIIPFVGGQPVTEKEWGPGWNRAVNRRARAYWACREMAVDELLALPPEANAPGLREEFLKTDYTIGNDDRIKLPLKEEIAARLGHSPDLADTVSMMIYAVKSRRMTIGGSLITM